MSEPWNRHPATYTGTDINRLCELLTRVAKDCGEHGDLIRAGVSLIHNLHGKQICARIALKGG